MKIPDRWQWDELRHRFVFTAEEKRVIAFVIAAFLLGLTTKCYRDTHRPNAFKIEKKNHVSQHDRPKPSGD